MPCNQKIARKEGEKMSELIVVAFPDETKAEEVRKLLFTMQKQYLLDLEDAVVVVKNHEGKVIINQTYNLVASGCGRRNALWRLMGSINWRAVF